MRTRWFIQTNKVNIEPEAVLVFFVQSFYGVGGRTFT
jgi:hypothetical protein